MDNLKMRRLLAFVGIAVITLGMIGIVYGIFKNDYVIQLLGLACVVVAYIVSVQVRRLRKLNENKDKE